MGEITGGRRCLEGGSAEQLIHGYMTRGEWEEEFEGYCGEGGVRTDRYYIPLPVESEDNLYFNGARPWKKERDAFCDAEHNITLSAAEADGTWLLRTNLAEFMPAKTFSPLSTADLGKAFESGMAFENPDGSPITFDKDYYGVVSECRLPGAFADIGGFDKEL